MAQIKSGATSDLLTIDPTSLAARVTPYDTRGNNMGMRRSYSASMTAATAFTAGTGVFFVIAGSANVIRVQKLIVCMTVATAAVYADIILNKRTTSTALSG